MALEEIGFILPDDPNSIEVCSPYIKRNFDCVGPGGQFRSWYTEGHMSRCRVEQINVTTCLKIRLTSNPEGKQAYLNDAKERINALKVEYPPVWQLRTEPPARFHDYQTLSQEKKDKIFDSVAKSFNESQIN